MSTGIDRDRAGLINATHRNLPRPASLLKRLGVPPRDALEILGHSRISVTMEVYTHVDDDSRRDALGKLDRVFMEDL